jgi:hypothetical protein
VVVIPKLTSSQTLARGPHLWAMVFASLVPGIGLAWLGKRTLALIWALAAIVSLLFLAAVPSLGAVFIFGALYFGQMLTCAVLAIWTEPSGYSKDNSPSASPFHFSQPNNRAVSNNIIDDVIRARVAGFDSNLHQPQLLTATPSELVLTRCGSEGEILGVERIPKENVFWVTLEIWHKHCLIMIEFYGNQRPPVILTLPRQAEEAAKEFLQEFFGMLILKISLRDALLPVNKVQAQPGDGLIFLIGLVILFVGAFLPGEMLSFPRVWALAVGSFLLPWPLISLTLRTIRTRSKARITNVVAILTLIVLIAPEWIVSILLLGLGIIRLR